MEVYNTYPIIATPYFDFGIIGIIIYMFIIGYISSKLELNKKNEICSLLLNVLFKYGLAFSFFVSYFSFPTFWFYLIELVLGKKILFILGERFLNE